MLNDKGFLSLIAIFVTSIVLVIAVFIIYLSHMNNLIINSSINGKQAFYLAESKIQLCLNEEKYYKYEMKPRLEYFLTHDNLKKYEGGDIICINNNDLNAEDSINEINVEFLKEENGLKAQLTTSSVYKGITQKILAIVNILNPFYEKGLPILSDKSICTEDFESFNIFFNDLKENIEITSDMKKLTPIEGLDFKKVILKKDVKLNSYIAHIFKNESLKPYQKILLKDNSLFLILRQSKHYKPILEIGTSNLMKSTDVIKGVIYVEGDIILYDNIQFCGIMIIEGGSVIVQGVGKPKINGMVILKDYQGDEKLLCESIDIDCDRNQIYQYGIFLPNFTEPNLYLIKNYE